ncbi:ABC transporter ATP-binding protein [Celeribacter sp. HF31]|uniref:ABC transporter ATP-binding protein n=1 Tax=Celeribacter sp. HF31 TaxID=2721558 RepID=UPI001430A608|nr:ABC transporter ATP-binding protein [Celeribacter sp. HF31]NIY80789.1 ABC transporter ATP-binding protein [Celeribacter sp. HF31]
MMQQPPISGEDIIVSLNRIRLEYGDVTALDDVHLQIRTGEFFTLLGPSGCGKTSLLQLIGGFQDPTYGAVFIDGKDVTRVPPYARPVNTVFQNFALFPHMTVAGNIRFGLEMLGWPRAKADRRVAEVLELVGLAGFGTRFPQELSGGQQQRTALARALGPEPRVLLLDEPMSALDLKLRKEMQGELARLHREAGITFIMVTHDQEEALSLSDRIAVLRYGKLRQVASPEELYHRPANSFVADFLGEANLIPAELLNDGPATGVIMVRPEAVTVRPGAGRVSGVVTERRFLGRGYELTVTHVTGLMLHCLEPSWEPLSLGQVVHLDWDDSAQLWLEQ